MHAKFSKDGRPCHLTDAGSLSLSIDVLKSEREGKLNNQLQSVLRYSASAGAVLAFATLFCAAPVAVHAAWKPDHTVEIVVPSGAGGGNDRTARTLQLILKETKLLTDTVVVNKPGGGGAKSYAYTHKNTGNGHYLSIARTGLLSNKIIGRSPITYSDMTPIAMVTDDIMALAVSADSPIKSVGDLIKAFKSNPKSIGIALGSSRGSTTEFLVAKIAQAAGVDPRALKAVTFKGSKTSITNLLGGHVGLVSLSIGNLVKYHKAGQIRIIGLAAASRAEALPDVKTIREQGVDVVQGGWTAIVGPPGLSKEQVAYWQDILAEATKHERWKKANDKKFVGYWFLGSKEAKKYLKADYAEVKKLLVDLGMAKK